MSDNRMPVPVSTLAKLFNLTDRRVQQLASDGIIPKAERGQYPLADAVKGYVAFLQARAFGKGGEYVDSHHERTRLLAAQAEKTEIEVDEKKGELVSAAAVRSEQFGLMRILRNNLQSMPDRITALVAAEGDPRLVHKLISGEVDRSLRGIIAKLEGEAVDDDVLDVNRREAVEHISPDVIEDADAD